MIPQLYWFGKTISVRQRTYAGSTKDAPRGHPASSLAWSKRCKLAVGPKCRTHPGYFWRARSCATHVARSDQKRRLEDARRCERDPPWILWREDASSTPFSAITMYRKRESRPYDLPDRRTRAVAARSFRPLGLACRSSSPGSGHTRRHAGNPPARAFRRPRQDHGVGVMVEKQAIERGIHGSSLLILHVATGRGSILTDSRWTPFWSRVDGPLGKALHLGNSTVPLSSPSAERLSEFGDGCVLCDRRSCHPHPASLSSTLENVGWDAITRLERRRPRRVHPAHVAPSFRRR